jgi:VCBS repeat-containing protein
VEGYLRKKWTVLEAAADSFSVLQNSTLYNPQSLLINDENSENFKLSVIGTSNTSHGKLVLYSDGSFYYIPDRDFTGQDSFTYVIYDGVRTSEEATVTIDVISADQHRLAVVNGEGSGSYPEGATVFIQADAPERTMIFSNWSGDTDALNDAASEYTFVTIPDHDITVTAEYTSIKTETPQYIISGYVSGAVTEGITVYLSGDMHTETVTDSDGYFQFSVTSGHYVVTPELSDYAFTPTEKEVTVTDSGIYDINFSINLWTISGTIQGDKIDGVTITLDSGESVVSGADGSFIFENIQDGTYTLTPSLDGYTFTPENASVTVAGADVTGIGFTSALIPETFTLTVNNGTGSGEYEENAVVEITALVPSGKVFDAWTGDTSYIDDVTAPTAHITMPASDISVTAAFKEPPADTFSISGTITGDVSENINVTLNDGTVTQTAADGSYTFAGLSDGTYTVTPSLDGYTFTPPDATVTVSGADVPGIDFISAAVPDTYTLTVNNGNGSGEYTENTVVEITAVIPSGKVFDAWTGDTSYIDDVTAPTAHITMPASDISVTAAFKDPSADTFTISGTVSGDVSEGVYLTLNNGTVTHTASDGSYAFAGLSDGTYTVTPSLNGYTFTPSDASVTVSGADVTGINFTSAALSGTYTLTVNNGTGSGEYEKDTVVEITALVPSGKIFDAWNGDTSYIDDINAPTANITMPASDITVTAAFKDPEPDTYSIAGTLSGDVSEGVVIKLSNGTATVTDADGSFMFAGLADGEYTLTPVLDGYIFTPENITVTISGNDALEITFTAVSAEKLTPAAYDDTYSVKAGTTFETTAENGVLVNDSSPDGKELTAQLVQDVRHGSLSLNEDGSFSYTPDQGFTGNDSFTYTATNGSFTSSEAVVTINILPDSQNIPPSAIADYYTVYCNVTLNVTAENGVLANDIELDENDTLKAVLASGPAFGNLEFNEDGSFKFTPEKNFTGIVTFSYKAEDSAGEESSTVQVTLEIRKIPLTTGMTLSVKADEVSGLKGEKFLKIPKIYGIVNGKNAALKKFKAKSTPDETFAVWGKKIRLYDKKAIAAAGYESYFESNGPLQPADVIINLKTKTASKEKIDETVKSAMIVPPVITQITLPDGSPIPPEGTAPGSTVVIIGKYFGSKTPKVSLEVNGKLLKCKVDKQSFKAQDFKGKPSPMDPETGESELAVILPAKNLTSGTYPLILDNKTGIATTPDNEDAGIKGKLPAIIIK